MTDAVSSDTDTRPIKAIPFPTGGDLRYIAAWDAWARQYGGLDADRTFVRIIVEGNSELPVVLTGLTVDVTRRARPPEASTLCRSAEGRSACGTSTWI